MSRPWTRIIATVVVGLAWPGVAAAQPEAAAESSPAEAEARAQFEAGRLAFANGRYGAALAAFHRAHELAGRPELLYNIGQAADRLRRDAEALEAFEAFVSALPDHPLRAGVDARIRVLRAQIAERAREPASDPRTTRAGPGAGPVVLTIAGGVVAIAGGVLLGIALDDIAELEGLDEPRPWPELQDRHDRAPIFSSIGAVGLGVGLAAVVAGILWWLEVL